MSETITYTPKERILICLTQLFCQLWFGLIKGEQTYPDESTSAFVYRTEKKKWIERVNRLMKDPEHCRVAYEREKKGTQQAPEYRAKFDGDEE